jgi:hypothetical protein
MAKSHFSAKKRQKELKRQEKQEKKRLRKMSKNETIEEELDPPLDEVENPVK